MHIVNTRKLIDALLEQGGVGGGNGPGTRSLWSVSERRDEGWGETEAGSPAPRTSGVLVH